MHLMSVIKSEINIYTKGYLKSKAQVMLNIRYSAS